MPQTDVMAWLHRAIGDLPMVTTHSDTVGGTEYQIGDVTLGHINQRGMVDLDTGPRLGGRLTIDLSQPEGGTVALWLLCRNYRLAASPNGATASASFEAPDIPPSIQMLDVVGMSLLRSSPPGP